MHTAPHNERVLLTITTTATETTVASDLGYLLHKHLDRVQSFDLPVGTAHVFYPESGEQRCTAALLLEVDPIGIGVDLGELVVHPRQGLAVEDLTPIRRPFDADATGDLTRTRR